MLQNIVCKSAHALFTWVETFAAGGGGTENKGVLRILLYAGFLFSPARMGNAVKKFK